MSGLLLFAAVFLLAFAGVAAFRKWSLKKGLLDSPNERSSHSIPTPRGGGVIVVVLCLIFYSVISYFYPDTFSWGYLLGAVIVAVVSWVDDLYSLWFLWRLAAHSAAATVLIISSDIETLGFFCSIISFFWIVWLINAYNFMDGIDGIAGLQAVIAATSWLALGYIFDMPAIYYFSGVIAASSLGFLIHNWQPAKIFMGDVGSAFLGFTFAALPLLATKQTTKQTYLLALAAVIFLWFFLFDSIVTFIHRLFKGKNVFSAHREHIYQRLVQSGMSHGKVTTIYGILTLILSLSMMLTLSFFNEIVSVTLTATTLLTVVLLVIYVSSRQKAHSND
jgi:Fuc2NAc and GlcNAc transferase